MPIKACYPPQVFGDSEGQPQRDSHDDARSCTVYMSQWHFEISVKA